MVSSRRLHKPASASFRLFSCSFLTCLRSQRTLELGRAWIRLLKAMCGCSDLLSRTLQTFHEGNEVISLSYHSCGRWRSTFHLLQELFLCVHNVGNGQRLSFLWPVVAFEEPPHYASPLLTFWFKVRGHMWLFLSLEYLEDLVGPA